MGTRDKPENRESPDRDAQDECRDHDREGKLRGTEGEAGQTNQSRLEGHHRETDQQCGGQVDPCTADVAGFRIFLRGTGDGLRSLAQAQRCVERTGNEIDRSHGEQRPVETQARDQVETRGQRTGEGAQRIQSVDERMKPRRVIERFRKRLGENRNRRTHQYRGRPDQQRSEDDIEDEPDARVGVGKHEGDRMRGSKQPGKRERIDSDQRLDPAVCQQEPPRRRAVGIPRDQAGGHDAEQ